MTFGDVAHRARAAMVGCAATVACAAMATPASATQVFFGGFDGVNGGNSAANVTSLAGSGLDIDAGRAVDLFHTGEGGVTCGAGFTSCISLESTDGRYGRLVSHDSFLAHAGDVVTMSFELSGNQRFGGILDVFNAGLLFTPAALPSEIIYTGPWAEVDFPTHVSTGIVANSTVTVNDPFRIYTESFVAPQDLNLRVRILGGNPGQQLNPPSDGAGPILDYIALDIAAPGSAAPEPASWAMLLAGFAGLGAALRRRRAAYA